MRILLLLSALALPAREPVTTVASPVASRVSVRADSDSVVMFQIDPSTGTLRPTGQTLEVGAPVSVGFVATR